MARPGAACPPPARRVMVAARALLFWALVYSYCGLCACIAGLRLLWSIGRRPGETFRRVVRENPPACLNDPSLGTHCYVRIKVRARAGAGGAGPAVRTRVPAAQGSPARPPGHACARAACALPFAHLRAPVRLPPSPCPCPQGAGPGSLGRGAVRRRPGPARLPGEGAAPGGRAAGARGASAGGKGAGPPPVCRSPPANYVRRRAPHPRYLRRAWWRAGAPVVRQGGGENGARRAKPRPRGGAIKAARRFLRLSRTSARALLLRRMLSVKLVALAGLLS